MNLKDLIINLIIIILTSVSPEFILMLVLESKIALRTFIFLILKYFYITLFIFLIIFGYWYSRNRKNFYENKLKNLVYIKFYSEFTDFFQYKGYLFEYEGVFISNRDINVYITKILCPNCCPELIFEDLKFFYIVKCIHCDKKFLSFKSPYELKYTAKSEIEGNIRRKK